MKVQELQCTVIDKAHPTGFVFRLPGDGPHNLLANSRNVKVTLTKVDGDIVHYELVERDGRR